MNINNEEVNEDIFSIKVIGVTKMKRILMALISIYFIFSISIEQGYSQTQVQVTKDKVLQYAKPKKPLKIKLHRDKKGEYSWDITGENVDDIIKADKRLRQLLKEE